MKLFQYLWYVGIHHNGVVAAIAATDCYFLLSLDTLAIVRKKKGSALDGPY